jgi:hypothetical protein
MSSAGWLPDPPVSVKVVAGYPSLSLAMATTATMLAVATIPMSAASPTTPTMATVFAEDGGAAGAGDACARGAGVGDG